MSSISDNFDLISQMVSETFNEVDEGSSYDDAFEEIGVVEDTNNVVLFHPIYEPVQLEFQFNYFLGAYDASRGCYVFQVEDQVIECPENWGPFKLATHVSGMYEDIFKLEKHEDIDFFFDIVEAVTGKSLKSLSCVNCSSHLKLVYEEDEQSQVAEVISVDFRSDRAKAA